MAEFIEGQIVEPNEDRSVARVLSEGNPELEIMVLEKKAELATRYRAAVETVLISQTYPADWTIQGGKACLSSAGAERVGRAFDIQFFDIKNQREDFEDSEGKGYRYICAGYATMSGGKRVYAEGSYSTRDEFLGKKGGAWRSMEDINEGDIRSAAHHIFSGNAIKALLGLRGMPETEYNRIMARTGQDTAKTSTVNRGSGTQGGSSAEDHSKQKALAEICLDIANNGYTVEKDETGAWSLSIDPSNDQPMQRAASICVKLSSFTKDGKTVNGKTPKDLKGNWLANTLKTASKVAELLEQGE